MRKKWALVIEEPERLSFEFSLHQWLHFCEPEGQPLVDSLHTT